MHFGDGMFRGGRGDQDGNGCGEREESLARKPLLHSSSLLSVPLGGHSGPGQGSQGYLLCGEMHVGGSQR